MRVLADGTAGAVGGRMRLRFLLPLVALAPLAAACTGGVGAVGASTPIDPVTGTCSEGGIFTTAEDPAEPGGIHGFASEQALDEYLAGIEARNQAIEDARAECQGDPAGTTADAGAPAPSAGADQAGSSESANANENENITNNQEAGVDEGGIVKNIGDHLVVLRKGRLYVAGVANGQPASLTDSMRVARTEALNGSVWYDEMLVKGDLIYVVGYRYGVSAAGSSDGVRGATEIDTFRLTNGKLARLKSMFLESNDYYSGKNYAGRMVDGKLVFYMPHYIGRTNGKLAYPRVLTADDQGKFSAVGPIFGALDVTTSLTQPSYPTFHTVVKCDLPETGELSCHGRSVIGSWWREHYVSPNAVYLWASSHVYRFDFASLDVSSHAAKGYPTDQFSFRESTGELLVAVSGIAKSNPPGSSTTPVAPPRSEAGVLALPLSAFDRTGAQPVVPLTSFGEGNIWRNRFVGDVLLAATDVSSSPEGGTLPLIAFDARTRKVTRTETPPLVRIEPLGPGRALLVTTDKDTQSQLRFQPISVAAPDRALSTLTLPGVREGEGRSHGFFFKPSASGDGSGTIGYAVVAPPTTGATNGWGNGISNLGFFDLSAAGALSSLGIVSAGEDESVCETSCVDWYGNTRPIFLRERAFALMGSELVEVSVRPEAMPIGAPVVLTAGDATLTQQ